MVGNDTNGSRQLVSYWYLSSGVQISIHGPANRSGSESSDFIGLLVLEEDAGEQLSSSVCPMTAVAASELGWEAVAKGPAAAASAELPPPFCCRLVVDLPCQEETRQLK